MEWLARRNAEAKVLQSGRLFRKYFLLILGLVCGALLISGAIGLYFSYQENQRALAVLQREKAIAAAARVGEFLFQIEQQLKVHALPQPGIETVEQRRIEFLKLLRQADAITDVAQIDARGRERLSVSRLKMDELEKYPDRSQDPAFKGARPGQTWFGPVYFRKETEPYMSIAVRSSASGPVTVAEVNLKFIWDVVSRIKVGQKGKAYVVDGQGLLVADPDIGLVLKKTDLSGLEQVRASLKPAGEDVLATLARDNAGTLVLSAFAPIELREERDGRSRDPLGWKVFVEQPVSEVYAGLQATVYRTVALMVAGVLFSVLAAIWLAGTMVRPIRTLQEGAQKIGEGDLDQQITVRTGDELQALAEQFNRMTARLRESYAGLERKVEERTNELKESLEQQTAIGEVLRVISSSPGDVQPVLVAVAERAARICDATDARIFLADGEQLRHAAGFGDLPVKTQVFPLNRESAAGRAVIDGRPVHVEDIHQERGEFPLAYELAARAGWRTNLTVPLLRESRALGAIGLRRNHVRPFTDKQIALLQTFADQAAIAIQNARLFREIQEKSKQLEVANKHKSDFLANMSHELRTPLNAIIGFSEVLLERMFGEVNEKQADYLKDIHESGKHLLSLINDILDLSKIEAGRMDLELSTFHLPSAISNAMTLIRERAQRHGIALGMKLDTRLGEFQADERKVKQILLNLLSNAVKFTPDGGRVDVAAALNGKFLEVSVRDTGIGIAAEDQSKVFGEFVQVGRDYTRKAEGTGLGLALTKRFVELHGGTIQLKSEVSQGSTFTFTLPIRP